MNARLDAYERGHEDKQLNLQRRYIERQLNKMHDRVEEEADLITAELLARDISKRQPRTFADGATKDGLDCDVAIYIPEPPRAHRKSDDTPTDILTVMRGHWQGDAPNIDDVSFQLDPDLAPRQARR